QPAGLLYLGRPGSLGPRRGAGRLSRYPASHEERGSARLSERAPRLHDAREPEGLPPRDARFFDDARAGDHRRSQGRTRTTIASSRAVNPRLAGIYERGAHRRIDATLADAGKCTVATSAT